MYFLTLSIGYLLAYPLITWSIQLFFRERKSTQLSFIHASIIFAWLLVSIVWAQMISDIEISNRILHACGGGMAIVLITYCASRASRIVLSRFQFFCIAFAIASIFGICNELFESVLQWVYGMRFALSVEDTWYDLWSNSIGALIAAWWFSLSIIRKDS